MRKMTQIRILLADDHHLFLDGIISLLKKEKDILVEGLAHTGTEALQLALTNDYDICLLDISMPKMDGIEVSKKIMTEKPDQKIIILTTYDDFGIITEMIHCGVKGYLLKNCSKTQLLEAIRMVASGKVYFTDEAYKAIMSNYKTYAAREKKPETPLLTVREIEIVQLLSREFTNDKIASALKISYRTVETHRKNIMHKTGAHNLAGLLKFAYKNGIV
jgi:DNA-binding NarL/FixJ family response regulator